MSLKFDGTAYGHYGNAAFYDGLDAWTGIIWVNVPEPGSAFYVIAGDDRLTGADGHSFWYDGRSNIDKWRFSTNDGLGGSSLVDAANDSVVNATWTPLISTWNRNDVHEAFVSGSSVGTATTLDGDFDYDPAHNFDIGKRPNEPSPMLPSGVLVGFLAYWDHIKSADDIAALSVGASPHFYPEGRIFFDPMWGPSNMGDLDGHLPFTEVGGGGALAQGDNPPIIMPAPYSIIPEVAAAAAGVPVGSLALMGVGR